MIYLTIHFVGFVEGLAKNHGLLFKSPIFLKITFMFAFISVSLRFSRLNSSLRLLAGTKCLSRCRFRLPFDSEFLLRHESWIRTLLFHCLRCTGGVLDSRSKSNCSVNGLNSPCTGVEIGVAGRDDLVW